MAAKTPRATMIGFRTARSETPTAQRAIPYIREPRMRGGPGPVRSAALPLKNCNAANGRRNKAR